MKRRLVVISLVLLPFVLAAFAIGGVLFVRQGGFAPYRVPHGDARRIVANDADTVARGNYLARIGNCITCHTVRGGVAFAGGRAFETGYGKVYSTNLTPDRTNGLGDWSPEEFAHTMRNGVSRHGILYPVFPYEQFARLGDADIDAIYAYLRTLPPSDAKTPPSRLEFPASWRRLLVAWRMLYHRDAGIAKTAATPADRGRYLVDGLGHCALCHSTRGARGSLPEQGYLAGGRIPGIGWYAPPLDGESLGRYSVDELAQYLRTGTSEHGSAYGPMAEVVYSSLRHVSADDATAMATYLKTVPARRQRTLSLLKPESAPGSDRSGIDGEALYRRECADCHGRDEEGKPGKYPPLRASVAVTAPDANNAARIVLYGAMPPTTEGNPRPYSMPPFVQRLSSAEIAAIVNYLRRDRTDSPPLTAADIESMHGIVVD